MHKIVFLQTKKPPEILAPIETTSFFDEERGEKDIVESGNSFVRSENLVAPRNQHKNFNTQPR